MKKTDWKKVVEWMRNHLINKYVITLTVFAVVLTFCGNQSLIHRLSMARELSEKENELREYRKKIDETQADLRALEHPDSLERFAREHYYMRADNEDVFLIDE